jgi:hypothetical protein
MDVTDPTSDSSPEPCCDKTCCKPKCRWLWGAVSVAVIVVMLFVMVNAKRGNEITHNTIIGPPSLKADAKNLKATVVSASADAPIAPGKNLLWCSTFQLVWNEGCRYAGGDIRVMDEPPMVALLNKKLGDAKDVDASSCLVMSGLLEKGIVAQIRQELVRKFQGQADPDLLKSIEADLPPRGWLAYSYLFRSLPFAQKFRRLTEPLEFGSAKVASFGLRGMSNREDARAAEQVAIPDYKSDDDFILTLQPEDKSEQIVLAKIAPAETLQKTIEAVRARMASSKLKPWEQSLEAKEPLVVPVLNFEVLREYDELKGKEITTAGPLKDMLIVAAIQSIRFRLDENGAVLKSEAALGASKGMPPKKLRQFIFDKPFLILLQRKDAAQPYFALWVDNPELLASFK